jgi:uncharacterized membrane protein YphA (DoxX/SURF4 family)
MVRLFSFLLFFYCYYFIVTFNSFAQLCRTRCPLSFGQIMALIIIILIIIIIIITQ